MTISIITCTGHRPEAFALCQKYIEGQTSTFPIQWIIVSDQNDFPKVKTTQPNIRVEQYKAPKEWDPESEYNTHRGNMELALSKVNGQYIYIMEDDDYYAPTYLNTMMQALTMTEAVTMVRSKYFHIGLPGYKELHNTVHGSLANTAISKWALPRLIKAVNSGHLYFDGVFWEEHLKAKRPHIFIGNSNISVGIKGMTGRVGITPSHRDLRDYLIDPTLSKLKEWIGESYQPYLEINQRIKDEKRKNANSKKESASSSKEGNQSKGSGQEKEVVKKPISLAPAIAVSTPSTINKL